MACESDKCEKYGMHHEYKDGVEIRKCQFCERDQPERSKREDFCLTKLADQYLSEWEPLPTEFATTEEAYIKGVYEFSDWLKQKMRCSEHDSNAVREVR